MHSRVSPFLLLVVDATISSPDLIRKHHRQPRQDNKHPDADQVSSKSPIGLHQRQPQAQTVEYQQQAPQEHVISSSTPHDAAEAIVNQEREAKLRMPSYLGLERFTLLAKMGE